MQKAKLFILSLAVLFSSASFCNAADINAQSGDIDITKIKNEIVSVSVKFWNEIGKPAWNEILAWYDHTAKPWLEENTSQQTKEEFSKESKEVVSEAPGAIKSVWDKIVELVK
jgi:hypothetical protein